MQKKKVFYCFLVLSSLFVLAGCQSAAKQAGKAAIPQKEKAPEKVVTDTTSEEDIDEDFIRGADRWVLDKPN